MIHVQRVWTGKGEEQRETERDKHGNIEKMREREREKHGKIEKMRERERERNKARERRGEGMTGEKEKKEHAAQPKQHA